MHKESSLNEKDIGLINEMSKKCSTDASQALSVMTGRELEVTIFDAQNMDTEQFSKQHGADEIAFTVYLEINGDISGGIALIFEQSSALKIAEILLNREEGSMKLLDDLGRSAIKETGNILAGNYLATLADILDIHVLESVPYMAQSTLNSALSTISVEMSKNADEALVLNMDIAISGSRATAQMLMFYDNASAEKLVKIIRSK